MNALSDFTKNGFLSFRRVINYVFPKTGSIEPNITQKTWFKAIAYLNPLLAILLMIWIFYWPKYLTETVGVFELFTVFSLFLCLILLLISVAITLFLLCCAAILKVKKRSPLIPLSLTLIFPLKAAIFIGFMSLLGYAFFPNSILLSDAAKCRLVRNAYMELHQGKTVPIEAFWGFRPGRDTYQEVVELLRQSDAAFEESGYLNNPRIPLIKINSYSRFHELEPLKTAELLFGDDKRLYSIKVTGISSHDKWIPSWDRKKRVFPNRPSKNSTFSNLLSLFYAKYEPLMQKSKLDEPQGHFFSPCGVKIKIYESRVELTVPKLEQRFQTIKKQVGEQANIEKGKQFEHLI